MEMGLQVLGQRTNAHRTTASGAYLALVLGGATGGAAAGTLLGEIGSLLGVHSYRGPIGSSLLLVVSVLTVRHPSREWGWRRQVQRNSSFGIRTALLRAFLWGIELGSGFGTVITQSATLVLFVVCLLTPIPIAAGAGAAYGAARLLRTWRGPRRRGQELFNEPMLRYEGGRHLAMRLNSAFVIASAILTTAVAVAQTI